MSRGFALALAAVFCAPIGGALVLVHGSGPPAAGAARAAPVAAAPPPAAPAVGSRPFVGRTSQRLAIRFRLTADGRRIERLRVTYLAGCLDDAIDMELADTFATPVPVAADGTFRIRALGARLDLSGRIAGDTASGTLRVDVDYGGLMQCSTPLLRWHASG